MHTKHFMDVKQEKVRIVVLGLLHSLKGACQASLLLFLLLFCSTEAKMDEWMTERVKNHHWMKDMEEGPLLTHYLLWDWMNEVNEWMKNKPSSFVISQQHKFWWQIWPCSTTTSCSYPSGPFSTSTIPFQSCKESICMYAYVSVLCSHLFALAVNLINLSTPKEPGEKIKWNMIF